MPPDTISTERVYNTTLSASEDSDKTKAVEKKDTKILTYCESNNSILKVEHKLSEHKESYFVGSVQIPVSIIGPFKINEKIYRIPIATRDEALVGDMNRIAEALFVDGVSSRILTRNMEAGSVVRFACEKQSGRALLSLNLAKNFEIMKSAYELASPCSILCRLHGYTAGEFLYIRFTLEHKSKTDDSMEIRNVTKGVQAVLGLMKQIFDDMKIVFCVGDLWCSQDKSCLPTATDASTHNHCKCKMTMESMGGCVVAESVVSAELIRKTLKCSVKDLIRAQKLKNLMGKSYAGESLGLNLQAANIVNAVFTAMGKNPVQTIIGSSCFTSVKPYGPNGQDVHISCTFPSLTLDDQEYCNCNLKSQVGNNFCHIIASVVLASQLGNLYELSKKCR